VRKGAEIRALPALCAKILTMPRAGAAAWIGHPGYTPGASVAISSTGSLARRSPGERFTLKESAGSHLPAPSRLDERGRSTNRFRCGAEALEGENVLTSRIHSQLRASIAQSSPVVVNEFRVAPDEITFSTWLGRCLLRESSSRQGPYNNNYKPNIAHGSVPRLRSTPGIGDAPLNFSKN
jgi:hypothetical protein